VLVDHEDSIQQWKNGRIIAEIFNSGQKIEYNYDENDKMTFKVVDQQRESDNG
jgi:YD repeat-containing protein